MEQLQTEHGIFTEDKTTGLTAREVYESWLAAKDLPPQPSDKERIEQLELDNADLWYENLMTKTQLETANQEIADLWYQIVVGGNA